MKDVDKRITDIVNKKINEPHSFENAIIHALDNVDNDKFNIRKMAVAICTTLIITTGIVHANEIRDYIITEFYYNHDQGIDEAINNGYIDLIDENQIAFGIKSDEISIEAYETDIIIKDMLILVCLFYLGMLLYYIHQLEIYIDILRIISFIII